MRSRIVFETRKSSSPGSSEKIVAVYERYDANPRRARIAHKLIGTAYRPRVSFLDNQTAHLVHDAVSSADVTILARTNA